MPEVAGKISCSACGKSYAWKPQYAGRTLKCSCGAAIKAPAAAPASAAPVAATVDAGTRRVAAAPKVATATAPAPVATSAQDEFEKIVASAEYDVAPEAPPKKPLIARPAMAAATAGSENLSRPAPTPMLGYGGSAERRKKQLDEGEQKALITDRYVPIGLIVLGIAAYYVDAILQGIHNPFVAALFVLFNAVIQVPLVFAALAAVALLPAAIADIIGIYTMRMVPWGLSILMYGGMLAYLFEMDFLDIAIVSAIMWVIGIVSSIALVALLLGALGIHSPGVIGAGGSGGGAGGGGGGFVLTPDGIVGTGDPADDPENDPDPIAVTPAKKGAKETPRQMRARQAIEQAQKDDVNIQAMLKADGQAYDARQWLKPENPYHNGATKSSEQVLKLVDEYYQAGAKGVWVAGISPGKYQFCNDFIIEMPDDPAQRKAVLELRERMRHDLPARDAGSKYLRFPIDALERRL